MRSYAVIPAAGHSRRLGRSKLLLPWRGTTLLEHMLGIWTASRVDAVVVVLREDQMNLRPRCLGQRVHLAVAEQPPAMKDSVLVGLRYIEHHLPIAAEDVWLLAPADMPLLGSDAIDRLLDEHDPCQPQILVPTCGQRRGHPVLLPWPLARQVAGLPPQLGVNWLLSQHAVRNVELPQAGVLEDLDTLEDWQRLSARDADGQGQPMRNSG